MAPASWKLALAPAAWSYLRHGVRLETADPRRLPIDGPAIFACLHRDILPAIRYVSPLRPVLLISTSDDGEILIRALGKSGFAFARGQTGSEGARALVELRRHLAGGRSVGVAVDGPEGPYGCIHPGAVQLARLTGTPIVPLRAEARGALHLKTWDRTLVPLPWSRIRMIAGQPLCVPNPADESRQEAVQSKLADFFGVGSGAREDS